MGRLALLTSEISFLGIWRIQIVHIRIKRDPPIIPCKTEYRNQAQDTLEHEIAFAQLWTLEGEGSFPCWWNQSLYTEQNVPERCHERSLHSAKIGKLSEDPTVNFVTPNSNSSPPKYHPQCKKRQRDDFMGRSDLEPRGLNIQKRPEIRFDSELRQVFCWKKKRFQTSKRFSKHNCFLRK